MIWQDAAISAATVLIIGSLVNQIYYSFKHKQASVTLLTSAMYFIALATISIAFFSLGLYFSLILMGLNASLWVVMFVQRLKYGSK